MIRTPKHRRCRGTVISYFLVLISVLTTGLLTTMALTSGAEAQVAGMTLHRDQAFYAAEAGVQRAYWLLIKNNNWRADPSSPLTGTLDLGGKTATYTVTVVGGWNSPVLITSLGTAGSGSSVGSITVTAACSPSVIVPAISLGNNFNNSGNVTINGDVQAKGNIDTSGSLKENGSLYAGGSITTQGSVQISGGAPNPYTPNITIPTINISQLKTIAQNNDPSNLNSSNQYYQVGSGNKPVDVTSINFGQGGVVYFAGAAGINFKGNVTITGYGTIVAEGPISVQAAASFGSSSQPANANVVTASSLDVGGYLGVVGSIYANGTITKHGGLDVTGIILGQQDLGTNGGMTITKAMPPFFDPRYQTSGAGSMVLSRVTGPIF